MPGQSMASRSMPRLSSQGDRILVGALAACALLSGGVLVLILGFLVLETGPLLAGAELARALLSAEWDPADHTFGLRAMIAGSLAVSGLALSFAAPAGIVVAVWGRLYAPPVLGRLYRGIIDILAGIPSVVYGFWGLLAIVPTINRVRPPGTSLLAGGLVLGLMILPLCALSTDAGLARVPQSYLRAAAALGLSRFGTLTRILLPEAWPAIVAGCVLQLGRALGETMAVVMVCGNVVEVPDSLFAPVRTLTANIALEMAYASGWHQRALFMSGLCLLMVTMVLFGLTQGVRKRAHGG
jgi:phosphate transport system permease protein